MSFFEQQPPDAFETKAREWAPPIWDRPSEGVLGVLIPVAHVLGQTDRVALALDSLRAYPNGVVFETVIVPNPRQPRRSLAEFTGPERWPRIGVEFSDGRRAGQGSTRRPDELAKDDNGIPTEPFLRHFFGGGGGGSYGMNYWLFPLPPPGQLKVFAVWRFVGMAETMVILDADDILDAARRPITLWQ
jgi:hypothetical protein